MDAAFETCVAYIMDDIRRPDLREQVERYIVRTLDRLHKIDYFPRDLVEGIHVFETSKTIQQINLQEEYPKFRRVALIRQWFPATYNPTTQALGSAEGGDFTEINPTRPMDGYGYDKERVWYLSGTTLNLRSNVAFDKLVFGHYRSPVLLPLDKMEPDWILQNYCDLVATSVKVRIFKNIGKDSESAEARKEIEPLMISFLGEQALVL